MAASAASDSLSIRSARASGWRAAPGHRVGAADQQPGLGAAEQLVARAADERRPGAHRLAQPRLARAAPAARRPGSAPEPMSSITGTPELAQLAPPTARQTNPTARKFDWWTRRHRPPASRRRSQRSRRIVRQPACGWSCRPRPARAPEAAITSGMRNPPPISTSCPRETITRPPVPASAATASSTAPAPLPTTRASWRAGQLAQQLRARAPGGCRAPPDSRSSSSVAVAGGGLGDRRLRRAGQRRPSQPGVDDHPGGVQHPPRVAAARSASASSRARAGELGPASDAPERSAARRSSIACRAARTAVPCGTPARRERPGQLVHRRQRPQGVGGRVPAHPLVALLLPDRGLGLDPVDDLPGAGERLGSVGRRGGDDHRRLGAGHHVRRGARRPPRTARGR